MLRIANDTPKPPATKPADTKTTKPDCNPPCRIHR